MHRHGGSVIQQELLLWLPRGRAWRLITISRVFTLDQQLIQPNSVFTEYPKLSISVSDVMVVFIRKVDPALPCRSVVVAVLKEVNAASVV